MHSTSSEVDTTPGDMDFSPPCLSPLPTMMAIQSPTASSDDLEEVWRSHVNKVFNVICEVLQSNYNVYNNTIIKGTKEQHVWSYHIPSNDL
jgi:hypothetical protein